MKKLTLVIAILLLGYGWSFSQLSGYYVESFESTVFPPTGWSSASILGANIWTRSTTRAFDGTASAYMQYQSSGGQDWLITPQFTVASGDSLTFRMSLPFQGYTPDSLIVRVSTTDAQTSSFTTRILRLAEGENYPPNNSVWLRYAVPLNAFAGQTIRLAFVHYNVDGDGVYIDKVTMGTVPPFDAKTNSVNTDLAFVGEATAVSAVVSNQGSSVATFDVTATINPGGYTSTQTVTALAPQATSTVNFDSWIPPAAGSYTLKVYTQLAGDANSSNDTITTTIAAFTEFENYGWSSSTALPSARWGHGQAFTKSCVNGTDTAFLYVVGGYDGSFGNATGSFRQNLSTGLWQPIANIITTRGQVSAQAVKGKIYVPGGYTSSFAPTNKLEIYDPATNTWAAGANLLQATGDYAIGTYADSLIYIVGGYSGSVDLTAVQVYNVNTNTWSAATSFPGTAVSGARMGITGNTLIYAGGYSQTLSATQSTAWKGVIDVANPSIITWTQITDIPVGPRGRLAGGAAFNDGRIYFTAGDPNGQGTSVQAETFAYNTAANMWEMGPNKITAVSNVCNLVSVVANDSIYLVTTGGYNGTSVVSSNEWINIGPYATPAAGEQITICGSGAVQLDAVNGEAYAWTPANLLSDATLANPTTDTLTQTTLFHVEITPRLGCNVIDSVLVKVNELPDFAAAITPVSCFGDADGAITLTGTAGAFPYTYDWAGAPTGDGTETVTDLSAGMYSVNVTDFNMCENQFTYTITQPTLLQVIVNNTEVTGCTGTLVATANGGVGTYTYSWTPGNQTTGTINNLCAGTYTVTVTDTNGCTATATATVTDNAGINEASVIELAVFPNPAVNILTVAGTDIPENALEVSIKDATGKTVYSQQVIVENGTLSTAIDLAGFSTGMYIVSVQSSSFYKSYKVVKK